MRALPDQPVFSRAAARAAGWSDPALSRAARAGKVQHLRYGWFAAASADPRRAAAMAAAHDVSGSVISHRSATLMHDLPLLGRVPDIPDLTVPPSGTGDASRAHLHRATLRPCDVVVVDGVPVTSPARTVFDLARSAPTTTGVVAMDAALHRGLVTWDELDELALMCWNWPGIRKALRAVRLADERSESPLESVSRLVLRWLRLPPPGLQPTVLTLSGIARGRLDFYWDHVGVAGEADGRSKYTVDADALNAEKERQERMEDQRIVFVRWGWKEATYQPNVLRRRALSAFERGADRDRAGSDRLWVVHRKPSTRPELFQARGLGAG